MRAKSRIWVQLSILAYVLILAAVAFLSVLPNIQEADSAAAQTVQVQQENSRHEERLRQLEQEFISISQIQSELAELQLEIPTQPDLPYYAMTLADVARAARVDITTFSMVEAREFSSEAVLESPVAEGTAIELPFTLVVQGDHMRLYRFVQLLQYSERLLTISYWQVDANSSTLNLNGVIYLVSNTLEEVDPRSGRIFDEIAEVMRSGAGESAEDGESEGDESAE